jgi:hypothetical protein
LDAKNRKKELVYLGILRILGFFRDNYVNTLLAGMKRFGTQDLSQTRLMFGLNLPIFLKTGEN